MDNLPVIMEFLLLARFYVLSDSINAGIYSQFEGNLEGWKLGQLMAFASTHQFTDLHIVLLKNVFEGYRKSADASDVSKAAMEKCVCTKCKSAGDGALF